MDRKHTNSEQRERSERSPPARSEARRVAADTAVRVHQLELDCRKVEHVLVRVDRPEERARLSDAISALSATLDELRDRLLLTEWIVTGAYDKGDEAG